MRTSTTLSRIIKYAVIVLGWLILWQMVSLGVDNRILLVGPYETVCRLTQLVRETDFWMDIGQSTLRILIGYLIGWTFGLLFALAAYRWKYIEDILTPAIVFLKAVPVAAFVVLFLIWWHSRVLAVAICICIVLPQIYENMLQGLKAVDGRMLEMAKIYDISARNKWLYIYRPSVGPYMRSAVRISAGMAWKSGVAAEIIGLPDISLGAALYMSKISLDTAGVLAYTLVIVAVAFASEKILLGLVNILWKCETGRFKAKDRADTDRGARSLEICSLGKKYGEKWVFRGCSAEYGPGTVTILNNPSGSGKTTLFRLIAGLERADEGRIYIRDENNNQREAVVNYLFQEDRLCEDYSALTNVAMVCGDLGRAKKLLGELLEDEDTNRPVKELSGGQKRRVALVRSLCRPADIILADEPYNGLDADNRERAVKFLDRHRGKSILIVATHIDTDEKEAESGFD